ncbi:MULTISPECIES: ATP-binding protein [unclassified Duganella]|uniref:hybrid sensor histidine kinase/response regulator n=1 Tax=unclassified Duganella TaxID=2636909 RepID=UPI000E345E39|nr:MULTISPECIES: ATP-binding protein [unclassified Duganella]RFP14529.1 hybrid sensor histidine kinase/response regulator [Duganella sp. BJB475]RFP30878.1 hybrid sensor histidine kinase/response regulator [Duganella sp. BJB476]
METRILIYAPTGQDATLAAKVMAMAAINSHVCRTLAELAAQLECGAGAVLTVEEALAPGGYKLLQEHVARQPDWSDLPIILLTHRGADSPTVRQAVAGLGNLNLIERPVRTLTLITAVHATLRARNKQYQVREAARRKDEFLASLGHELRNPLAPIRTSVSLLTHMYPDAPPVARIRDMVERQVRLLTRLVDDLLDVARITSGKITLQRQQVSLAAVMNHVGELCLQAADAKRITIGWQLPAEDVMLDADYARVVQIIANIVSNAVKFTPQGGQVAVCAQCHGDELLVTVRDNGIGLDTESIARIFRMFEQSKTVAGQFSSGLGIGLSLARRFAEMHGGSVEASSAGPGQGSEFAIRLPVLGGAARDPVTPSAAGAADGRKLQVLVVDDNQDAADSLAALLEIDGFDAHAVYDGASAIAASAEHPPDLIILDLGMPGMDGYETARAIRQRPGADGILMIALTGWGQGDARRRSGEAGFDHHLVKPVELDQIVRLAGARQNREQVQAAR